MQADAEVTPTFPDMDATTNEQQIVKCANRRRSVFNISLPNPKKEFNRAQFVEHKSRLQAEMKEWAQILKDSKNQLKAVQNSNQRVDISFLPAEKRDYVKQVPNLQKFVRESLEFRKEANGYLKIHLPNALDEQENLRAVCEYFLELRKQGAIGEVLANYI